MCYGLFKHIFGLVKHIFGLFKYIFGLFKHILGLFKHIFGLFKHIFGLLKYIFGLFKHIFGLFKHIFGLFKHIILFYLMHCSLSLNIYFHGAENNFISLKLRLKYFLRKNLIKIIYKGSINLLAKGIRKKRLHKSEIKFMAEFSGGFFVCFFIWTKILIFFYLFDLIKKDRNVLQKS